MHIHVQKTVPKIETLFHHNWYSKISYLKIIWKSLTLSNMKFNKQLSLNN